MTSVVQPSRPPLPPSGRHSLAAASIALLEGTAVAGETLGDRVTHELRALLIAGRLGPGEKLSLRRVAEALGVSMMPVRAAVSRLAADGALEVLPGRAVRVPVLTLSQFRELTQIRLVVEGFAAEEAARRITPGDLANIAPLEAAFRDIAGRDPLDSIAAVAANRALHDAIYRIAGMPTLIDMIDGLWLKVGPIINLDMRTDPARVKGGSAVQAHAAWLHALKSGDPDAARAALQADIRAAARHVEDTGSLLPDAPPAGSASAGAGGHDEP